MISGRIRENEIPIIPIDDCIAKTSFGKPGISVENHCRIVGLVANELISLFPLRIALDLFPKATGFIAACHDIGKVSPAFQKMILANLERNDEPFVKYLNQLSSVNAEHAGRRQLGFHAAVSQISLEGVDEIIPEIIGIHHGFSPLTGNMQKGCFLHGGLNWQRERDDLVERLREYFLSDDKSWPRLSVTQARVISGLVTVADWIGSGDCFADITLTECINNNDLKLLVKEAVSKAGFHSVRVKPDLLFRDVFPFEANNIQKTLILSAVIPGVYVLEAPMGIGKTEAALFAAYRLLAADKATGIYFALPTQLTSERIHDRMELFLERVIENNSAGGHARLLHGYAWIKENTMGENADAGGSWFDGTKRGILAPFAAGTIDQALMAVMNVRHGLVRSFGLTGKVVILDEVHSYDSYTGTIINKLIAELLKQHCTIIILSATLTQVQRRNLLNLGADFVLSDSYPLISAIPSEADKAFNEIECAGEDIFNVNVFIEISEDKAIDEVLVRSMRGEQVLWIENTVTEAQEIFRRIAPRCDGTGICCGLLHSRFIKHDRERIESEWVALYGKDGITRRGEGGRVLVGTQVLEQSLDIDADFLVTRICPSDMLLQRIGRLWRHRIIDNYRPKGASCDVHIIAPAFGEASTIPKRFGKSGAVYSEYVLLRTLEIWKDRTSLTLPSDIREILETTYSEREETGLAARYLKELHTKREKLQQMARIGLSQGIATLPESKASTRYSELDTVDVLLLSSFHKINNVRKLNLIEGKEIEVPATCHDRKKRRVIAAAIMKNCVRVAEGLAPKNNMDISWLSNYVYIGSKDDDEETLRIAIVQKDDEIVGVSGEQTNDKYLLKYDKVIGYQSEKR